MLVTSECNIPLMTLMVSVLLEVTILMYELLGSYLCCVGQKVFILELLDKQGDT